MALVELPGATSDKGGRSLFAVRVGLSLIVSMVSKEAGSIALFAGKMPRREWGGGRSPQIRKSHFSEELGAGEGGTEGRRGECKQNYQCNKNSQDSQAYYNNNNKS